MPGLDKDGPEMHAVARKALSIGITYKDAVQYSGRDAPPELVASHGDPEKVKQMLTQFYGYKEEDIVIMKDDGKHTLPTRENILTAIDELVKDAKAGDRFVFHFSGHGAQIPDENGDEEDGMDEVIWPVDVIYDDKEGTGIDRYIVDDELKERLVDRLPVGTYLTVILDSCHSGSGIDLPHSRPESEDEETLHKIWSPITPKAKSRPPFAPATTRGSFQLKLPHMMQDGEIVKELKTLEECVVEGFEEVKAKVRSEKHVTSWAACVDDTLELESPDGGMLTMAFWNVLRKNRKLTHEELFKAISEHLVKTVRPGKKQVLEMGLGCPKPVLASLQKLDVVYPIPFSF
ncbi:uncharacterized protein FOMMEDRAFT_142854 [Fomitiporia mediterranea MF3/22]|uniref:uncharacterized protein n=1 Tax=Fomitiporia mediterranea (strain MF3/22) TaxID=694068 RepID=UPI00044089A2|nr:uncharacterized protein FOMMEDRAFT_142854 [Fomitiporia mediterranea MF3/22]EJC99273.1 hypothetical protein FOMMEDRAFT_142854 [Fomitiporia mediterranea MF3/22]